MIVLDTNVISETLRPKPSGVVADWVKTQPAASLYTTVITRAEILLGVALLPEGKRKRSLETVVSETFDQDFAGRVLPVDNPAAVEYARIVAMRRHAGRPISHFDALIAAIAKVHSFAIATRDEAGYAGCGVTIVNPWRT